MGKRGGGTALEAEVGCALAPFDAVADVYDRQFTGTPLGRVLRRAVWDMAAEYFQPGMRVLEIGCGTGEDAVWLAGRGVRVTATDASSAMIAVTRAKAQRLEVADLIEAHHCPAERLPDCGITGPFDGVFSNFGALNCVPSLPALAGWFGRQVRPGGTFFAVVLGPWCPWEVAWHLLHGEPRTAIRRLRPGGVEAHVGASSLQVWYPSARSLARLMEPEFRFRLHAGLGILLPPCDLRHLVERWPSAFEPLARRERRIDRLPVLRSLGDHYVLALERAKSG